MANVDFGFSGRMPNPVRFRPPPSSTMVPPTSDLMNARILLPVAPFGMGPPPSVLASSMNQQQQNSEICKINNLNNNNNMLIEKSTNDENLTENIELPTDNNNKQKEKTPMCLIAELVRYNKLAHQYKLVNESGPAHQKQFTVCLILRDGEEYAAEGPSIKKAQQAAAKKAIDATKLPRPSTNRFQQRKRPPFTGRDFGLQNTIVPPTVALNELAAKFNLSLDYSNLAPIQCNPPFIRPPPPMHQMFPFGQPRFVRPRLMFPPPLLHSVCLKVGQFEFYGRGLTRQLARHEAASKACKVLQQMQENILRQDTSAPTATSTNTIHQNAPVAVRQENCNLVANEMNRLRQIDEFFHESSSELNQSNDDNVDDKCKRDLKSPISIIHEMALQKKMDVTFEVVSETGPAHDRAFVIRLILRNCGQTLITEGEGPCKKRAKHQASEKMIEELKKHLDSSPIPTSTFVPNNNRHRVKVPKDKKRKTIIKDVKMDPNYGQQINPISRLVQVQQAKKEAEPVFTLVKELGQARYKEYVMLVSIGDRECQGTGPNKKLAKRAAAEAMLDSLGYSKPMPKPGKPLLKHQTSFSDDYNGHDDHSTSPEAPKISADTIGGEPSNGRQRRVTFNLQDASETNSNPPLTTTSGKLGRQIAPGLLLIPGSQNISNCDNNNENLNATEQSNVRFPANGSKSLLEQICSANVGDAKSQLTYLSSLLKFQMQFTDFPKTLRDGSGGEYLSLISLGLNPSQVFHGSGATVEIAQNEAAAAGLRYLAEKGLDNVLKTSSNNGNGIRNNVNGEDLERQRSTNEMSSKPFISTIGIFSTESEE